MLPDHQQRESKEHREKRLLAQDRGRRRRTGRGRHAGDRADAQDQQESHPQHRVDQRRLPEERQQLLTLKFVDGMSNAEIGEIMDRTEGAIKSLYHRTLLALREELQSDNTAESRRKNS